MYYNSSHYKDSTAGAAVYNVSHERPKRQKVKVKYEKKDLTFDAVPAYVNPEPERRKKSRMQVVK